MKCEALANAIDIYFANHTYDGRPKFERKPGNSGNREYHSNRRNYYGNVNRSQTGSVTATRPRTNRAAANDRRDVSQNVQFMLFVPFPKSQSAKMSTNECSKETVMQR